MRNQFTNIKVLFFDMGNTLIDFHQGPSDVEKDEIGINNITNYIYQKCGLKISSNIVKSEFIDKWYAIMPERKKLHKEFQIEGFLDPFLEMLKIQLNRTEKIVLMKLFDSEYQKYLVTENNLDLLLKDLTSKYRIGVISNSPSYPEVNIDHFKFLKLDPYIEHYIFSYSIMIAKPQPEIFQKALETFSIVPEQSVMIGDSLSADIAGANNLGIKTIWLNTRGRISNDSSIIPDGEIKSLVELKSILL